ncbi:MAG: hypothetical protein MUC96_22315 [Myxococcaceae bacterium]|jgi:hypothetical protein|nr:hypothetical protein [Myxococcaceae bacterium]
MLVTLVTEVRRLVLDEDQGKRFGDSLLDSIRELVRFSSADTRGMRGVTDIIARDTRERLLAAPGLDR